MPADDFYSRYFRKQTFLSPGKDAIKNEVLKAQGLLDPENYRGKNVIEIGAGAGRLTFMLDQHGLLQTARRYTIVEPSSGINQIRGLIGDRPNVSYMQCAFSEVSRNIPEQSADYIIALGVIPHIDQPLTDIFMLLERMINAESGRIHVCSSFWGFDKKLGRALYRRVCHSNHFARWTAAYACTVAQRLCTGARSPGAWARWFHRNFIYSIQPAFAGVARHHFEYFSAVPYNTHFTPQDYLHAANKAGLQLSRVYPYSIALQFGRGVEKPDTLPSLDDMVAGNTRLVGEDDFFRDLVVETCRRRGFRFEKVLAPERAIAEKPQGVLVLGDNYYRRSSLQLIRSLENAGYRYNDSLFLFQMLL